MLYGTTIEDPGDDAEMQRANTFPDLIRQLESVNQEAHGILKWPSNFMDLPECLAGRVWELTLENWNRKIEAAEGERAAKLKKKLEDYEHRPRVYGFDKRESGLQRITSDFGKHGEAKDIEKLR